METSSTTRDQCVFMARLAEEAKRFKEMITYVNKFATTATELSVEERHLFYVAYKNAIAPLRSAIQAVSAVEREEEGCRRRKNAEMAQGYKSRLEMELKGLCGYVFKLLENYMLPSAASNSESKVFYLKMKGDFLRYMSEFKVGDQLEAAAQPTLHAYEAAMDIARRDLAPTHPTRLALALNYAVFHGEILSELEKACDISWGAFDEAIEERDSGEEKYCEKTILLMRCLKKNHALWKSKIHEKKKNIYFDY